MSKTLRNVFIIVLIITIAFFAWNYFVTPKVSNQPLQSSNPDGTPAVVSNVTAVSNEFVNLLLNLKVIKLDDSIFTSSSFDTLVDFSVPIIPEGNEGRPNPFSPIGIDIAVAPKTESVKTNAPTQITATSAVLNGVLPTGTIALERWFEWGTINAVPLTNTTTKVTQNPTTGLFTFALAPLSPNTTYYVRAVSRIGTVVVYGSVLSFKTLAGAPPVTN